MGWHLRLGWAANSSFLKDKSLKFGGLVKQTFLLLFSFASLLQFSYLKGETVCFLSVQNLPALSAGWVNLRKGENSLPMVLKVSGLQLLFWVDCSICGTLFLPLWWMILFLIYLNFSMRLYQLPIYYQNILILTMFDQIYLTGFKKFGTHEVNPTQLVSEHFAEQKVPGLRCATVEVTTKDADAYVESIRESVVSSKERKILNLHFGVGPNKVYRFQRCCYNNKDFGIPDNLGYQPRKEQICLHEGLDHPIFSKLNVEELQKTIQKDFASDLSVDPGRYLCNYIYFKSCHDLSSKHEHVYSLFIHFPVLAIAPHEKNVKFVERLLQLLLKKPALKTE